MKVNDAVEPFAPILTCDVLINCSDQVADVLATRGLDSRKDPH
jgi:hypothetical protein